MRVWWVTDIAIFPFEAFAPSKSDAPFERNMGHADATATRASAQRTTARTAPQKGTANKAHRIKPVMLGGRSRDPSSIGRRWLMVTMIRTSPLSLFNLNERSWQQFDFGTEKAATCPASAS
jgi:hypothetical protein